MIKQGLIFFILLLCAAGTMAQDGRNARQKNIPLAADTVWLDTLSLIPGTLQFANASIDTSCYRLDPAKAMLTWKKEKLEEKKITGDSVKISYRTFPFNLTKSISHKDIGKLEQSKKTVANPFSYTPDTKSVNDIFNLGGLNKNGSISRGITFGNSQDVVVNSNLNLQLSGRLSDNIDILLSASDDNIPIQPEGNTQQLQEFDKVFIQLSDKTSKLIAGDFILTRPNSYFMNFNKKAQGLSFSNTLAQARVHQPGSGPVQKIPLINTITASGAVSKGKFARNQFQGVESNQGPYRLHGAENELFIIILSGTEKVYIDGELMQRGQENDYVIDYNTAEIRFTPRQKITKDKRITVEFQYSDKNYARSLYFIGDDLSYGKLKLHVNYYSEQDSKNKPLQQQLSDTQKVILASVGDSLTHAVVPAIDSIAYNTSDVLYLKKDSTVGSFTFRGIFVHSTDTAAHFRLGFSYVGENKGNYVQENSAANGKVFRWVMPDTLTNAPRGSYEPVILLVTPKKKQMLTSAVEYSFNRFTRFYLEGALTDYDINLFSPLDKANDKGYALKTGFDLPLTYWRAKSHDSLTDPTGLLLLNVNYELAQKNFSPIERYRSVEFERDWNRSTLPQTDDQRLFTSSLTYMHSKYVKLGYQFNTFLEGNVYQGLKHNVFTRINTKKYVLNTESSMLNSETRLNSTAFFRSRGNAARKFGLFTLGARGQYEHNEFFKSHTDSLTAGSYEFGEWEGYVSSADSARNKFQVSYKQRTDNLIKNYSLHKAAFAENVSFDMQLLKNPNQQFRLNVTYRNLRITDTTITVQKPDNSLLGRAEYNFQAWKGLLTSGTYCEIGSGLELKKEFTFIQVPPGQGVYTWIDYNGNGIKELNEFEVAAFPDQATYIKVFMPTNQYIKTYTNSFSQTLSLKPAMLWSDKKGMRKFATRFADQAAYRVDRKSTDSNLSDSYNPFLKNLSDSTLISLSSSLRNTVFFNQVSPVFGIDHTYSDTRNKTLLTNGFDTRANTYHELRGRWNLGRQFTLQATYRNGNKSSTSQFFSSRNYRIAYSEAEPKLSYQPGTSFRVSLSYKYSEKNNSKDLGGQQAVLHNIGAEMKYNVLNKGSLLIKVNYIRIAYNDAQNTSLAFEMLESLKVGENITWSVAWQRSLSNNMQLSLTYDGRRSEGAKVVHVGGVQVRAYF